MDTANFEQEVIQAQARTFEELKPRLIERWGSSRKQSFLTLAGIDSIISSNRKRSQT